tara:strand:- start:854 stop:1435 length:582 start_codon:yes stop_codon:yes gene_type:complete
MQKSLKINNKAFIIYKLFNSLFLGVSIGAVFTIYEPLEPTIYSVGGIALAIGMLIIAKFYHKILNINYFFIISLIVEFIVLILLIFFLIFKYNYQTALLIYIGYQITFIFGSYLVRVETLVINDNNILTKIDMAKQIGYLIGMGTSYITYKLLEKIYFIEDAKEQVYLIHFLLIFIELLVLFFLIKSFKKTYQ